MIADYPVADCPFNIHRVCELKSSYIAQTIHRKTKAAGDARYTGWHASQTTGEQESAKHSAMHSAMPHNTTAPCSTLVT